MLEVLSFHLSYAPIVYSQHIDNRAPINPKVLQGIQMNTSIHLSLYPVVRANKADYT